MLVRSGLVNHPIATCWPISATYVASKRLSCMSTPSRVTSAHFNTLHSRCGTCLPCREQEMMKTLLLVDLVQRQRTRVANAVLTPFCRRCCNAGLGSCLTALVFRV
ncbi:hypothetical protein VFPPC_18010 [Pochonia chlamydosporia 170]|uniref:Uncharacterized protein n=1 Tax=Pochonia chlamydosporia 170 TaxID=1380566 RepID=A0A219ARE6_METCM|nr:hypothetical protein VFPPC_18010 [Pochonia chlamydosporia 170]OWT42755.1 hypothetical protein VFPPC_18010 [Pochonia chlamydosporia 170]